MAMLINTKHVTSVNENCFLNISPEIKIHVKNKKENSSVTIKMILNLHLSVGRLVLCKTKTGRRHRPRAANSIYY